MPTMKAMIMAAGVGTRLQPLTITVPKPMVPIANSPAIHHILRLLHKHGVQEAILNLHYHGDQIYESLGDGSAFGMVLAYSREQELLGTAGGVKRVQDFLRDDTFLVISGDALTDIDLGAMLAYHRHQEALATIALKHVQDTSRLGVVVTKPVTHQIHCFQEKPKPEEALSNWVNTGIYIFEPAIFERIPADTFYDFGTQLFPKLAAEEAPFFGFQTKDYWCDIGSLSQYRLSHYDVLQEKVEIQLPGTVTDWGWRGADVDLHPKTTIMGRHLLGNNVTIGQDVVLMGGCTIGDNCRIEAGAVLNDVVVWSNTSIGAKAVLDGCVVGNDCSLMAGSQVGEGAVLSDDVVLESGTSVAPNIRVWPGSTTSKLERLTADQRTDS